MGNRHDRSLGYPGAFQRVDLFPGYTEKNFVTREQWGALPPDRECPPLKHPIQKVRYGYTSTDMCFTKEECIRIVKQIQEDHLFLGCPDIVHNFLVGSDGNVYEGRGWFHESCITQGEYDLKGITLDVALIGPFSERGIPDSLIDTAISVANYGMKQNYLPESYDGSRYEED